MKYIKWGFCLFLIIVFAFFYAHVDVKSYIYDRNLDTGDYGVTGIESNVSIKQKFISSEKVIKKIQIKGSISGDVSVYNNKMIQYSIEDEKGNLIESHEIALKKFENNQFVELEFDKLNDCKNKELTLVLEESGMKTGVGISFYFTPTIEDGTEFIVNNNQTEGTLVMRTVVHKFDIETFIIVLCFAIYLLLFLKLLYKLFR